MLGLVVLADEVHHGVRVSDSIAHASLVGRAVITAENSTKDTSSIPVDMHRLQHEMVIK